MMCEQPECEGTTPASSLVYWPGRKGPIACCPAHTEKARQVAAAMGMDLTVADLEAPIAAVAAVEVDVEVDVVPAVEHQPETDLREIHLGLVNMAEQLLGSCLHDQDVAESRSAVWCTLCGAIRFREPTGRLSDWRHPKWRTLLIELVDDPPGT